MIQPSLLHDSPTIFRRAVIVVVACALLGGIGWRIGRVLAPPPLALLEPATTLQSVASPRLTVRGTTEPGAALTINGAPYVPDATGAFTADIVLLPGVNTITVEARRRHSRPARVERTINVHRADAPLAGGPEVQNSKSKIQKMSTQDSTQKIVDNVVF